MTTGAPRLALGVAAGLGAATIWAGWLVLVRAAPGAGLGPLDVALLRYGVPALALAPVWLRLGPAPAHLSRGRLAAMALGWGAPFALLVAEGARSAPTALAAALVPGSMPLWAALIAAAALGARPGLLARAGFAFIAAAAALAAASAEGAALDAVPWLLAAAVAWAAYAVAYRGSGLSPLEATALVAFWSAPPLLAAALLFGERLSALAPGALAAQVALHGLLSGVVATALFAGAIAALGAARAAAFAALTPGLAALGGWIALGEVPTAGVVWALAAATAGVALVNLAPVRPPRPR
jgi:drug/metabolite transporter (DMT)-like permease